MCRPSTRAHTRTLTHSLSHTHTHLPTHTLTHNHTWNSTFTRASRPVCWALRADLLVVSVFTARQLKQMQDENLEFEGKITAKARAIARQREDFINAQAKLAEFQDEVRAPSPCAD